jgi:hypothetical protein
MRVSVVCPCSGIEAEVDRGRGKKGVYQAIEEVDPRIAFELEVLR